jgi:hypothetical protein
VNTCWWSEGFKAARAQAVEDIIDAVFDTAVILDDGDLYKDRNKQFDCI